MWFWGDQFSGWSCCCPWTRWSLRPPGLPTGPETWIFASVTSLNGFSPKALQYKIFINYFKWPAVNSMNNKTRINLSFQKKQTDFSSSAPVNRFRQIFLQKSVQMVNVNPFLHNYGIIGLTWWLLRAVKRLSISKWKKNHIHCLIKPNIH